MNDRAASQNDASRAIDSDTKVIFLVSDGTCRTCEQVARAVLVQFEHPLRMVHKTSVRDVGAAQAAVREAAEAGGVILYTLIAGPVREAMREASARMMVPAVDVLGPVMRCIDDYARSPRREAPGRLYQSNREYFDRIDAVEFTLAHDDGCRLNDLDKADVVLVGVSRSSKSTTCFFLAYSGIRAANVPLFADAEPPRELRELDPRRVIGLIANAHRLQAVREARLMSWEQGLSQEYVDRVRIGREIRASREQMERYGWRWIDVSYKATEEVAREVRQMLAESGLLLQPSN